MLECQAFSPHPQFLMAHPVRILEVWHNHNEASKLLSNGIEYSTRPAGFGFKIFLKLLKNTVFYYSIPGLCYYENLKAQHKKCQK